MHGGVLLTYLGEEEALHLMMPERGVNWGWEDLLGQYGMLYVRPVWGWGGSCKDRNNMYRKSRDLG
jgi:hypothetical protein